MGNRPFAPSSQPLEIAITLAATLPLPACVLPACQRLPLRGAHLDFSKRNSTSAVRDPQRRALASEAAHSGRSRSLNKGNKMKSSARDGLLPGDEYLRRYYMWVLLRDTDTKKLVKWHRVPYLPNMEWSDNWILFVERCLKKHPGIEVVMYSFELPDPSVPLDDRIGVPVDLRPQHRPDNEYLGGPLE